MMEGSVASRVGGLFLGAIVGILATT